MDPKTLQSTLAKLHQELSRAPQVDAESRRLLTAVLADAQRLTDPDRHRLEDLAVGFEAEHPRLAASVREFVDLLGRAGV